MAMTSCPLTTMFTLIYTSGDRSEDLVVPVRSSVQVIPRWYLMNDGFYRGLV